MAEEACNRGDNKSYGEKNDRGNDEQNYDVNWVKKTIKTKIKRDNEIVEEATKAFGVSDFKGFSRKTQAKFVQLSDDTSPEHAYKLLTKHWGLPKPKVLISIIGGAMYFKIDDRLNKLLFDGLRKINESPDVWVFTGGTRSGIMKFIGESLQGVCDQIIGIAPWGAIKNTDKLYGSEKKPLGGVFDYEVASSIVEKEAFLDHNHTHFLLADNASKDFGVEVGLVSKLMSYVAHADEIKVPAVLILIEGGPYSLENVIKVLQMDNPVPVLVIKGSGRASDILCYAYEHSSVLKENKGEMKKFEDFIRSRLPNAKQKDRQFALESSLECLKYSKMISIVESNQSESLDEKILQTILQYYKMSPRTKLQYSVLWNREDVAHNLIKTQSRDKDIFLKVCVRQMTKAEQIFKSDIVDAFIMSLALNRYKFVEYFIEQNVFIHKLLTQPCMEFLYGHRSSRRNSIVKRLVKAYPVDSEQDRYFQLIRGHVPYTSIDEAKVPMYEEIVGLINTLCEEMILFEDETFVTKTFEEGSYCKYPYRDLFIWSVVNNMQDMSKYLWKIGDEQIAKAIIAAHINKKLSEKALEKNESDEIINMFKKNESEYKELAIKVLVSCYNENMDKTKAMLTINLTGFNSHNCLSLAHASGFEEFIAQSAVQTILNDLWLGNMKFDGTMIFFTQSRKEALLQISYDVEDGESKGHQKQQNQRANDAISINSSDEKSPLHDGGVSFKLKRKYNSCDISDGKELFNRSESVRSEWEEFGTKESYRVTWFKSAAGKFYGSLISYCVFLVLFSYTAIREKDKTDPSIVEIIVFVWVFSIAIEEIYQLVVTPGSTWLNKLQVYVSSLFNIMDLFAIVLYFVAYAMQLSPSLMEYGHLLYAFDSALWIVRLLQYFYASKILGPYVLMIGKMFIDMLYFISILGVFLLAYGVLSAAILKPEKTIYKMIVDVIFHPYFNIYGELFTDSDSQGFTQFGTKKVNDYAEPLSWIFLGMFLLIANVLLLNLLIAIFGTFSEVQQKSDQIWKFKRYGLITESTSKLPLPPPFTVAAIIWVKLYKMYKRRKTGIAKYQELWNNDETLEKIGRFQVRNVTDVLRVLEIKQGENNMDTKKLEDLTDKVIPTLQNQMTNMQEELTNMIRELQNQISSVKEHTNEDRKT